MSDCPVKISCGVYDAVSSICASRFSDFLFVSGLSLASCQYLEHDKGTHSIERVISLLERLSLIEDLKPFIVDIDDSFGDYTLAGHFARRLLKHGIYGVVIEDQARPRKCGHKSGKVLNPIHKYCDGIKRLRDESADIFIVARTDAETPDDLEKRLEALLKLSEEGYANAIQVDGISNLSSIEEVRRRFSPDIKFVANHVDGGRLMDCTFSELSAVGVDILTLSTLMASHYIHSLSSISIGRDGSDGIPHAPLKLQGIEKFISGYS